MMIMPVIMPVTRVMMPAGPGPDSEPPAVGVSGGRAVPARRRRRRTVTGLGGRSKPCQWTVNLNLQGRDSEVVLSPVPGPRRPRETLRERGESDTEIATGTEKWIGGARERGSEGKRERGELEEGEPRTRMERGESEGQS